MTQNEIQQHLEQYGQEHLMMWWHELNPTEQHVLLDQIESIDFPLMKRLIDQWVHHEPAPESFEHIVPIPTIPVADMARPDAREAWDAGEEALRQGRVGLLLVAGGQGTRLGYDGPKGAYPIGPISRKSLFAFHAEKIHNLQRRYGCVLPWYIMVSQANAQSTERFFQEHHWFGLDSSDIFFFQQRMVPCVDEQGRFLLEEKHRLAMNPNGHGGVIPALVENGIVRDCRDRGIDTLSYFQVDNWAVKVADPFFIGYHVLANGEMSSKNHRKNDVREAVGVHCLCDGAYRVIEYSALDIYPQLLEANADGSPRYYAGNPAIHIINTDFVERVFAEYDQFPWWRAHKKIPYIDISGNLVKPDSPNGYKFETFVFDALRFIRHAPIGLEIVRQGEYTPIKQFDGDNSVQGAWASMAAYWAEWLEAAGCSVPRDTEGRVSISIEISPAFALTKEEFVQKMHPITLDPGKGFAIDAEGQVLTLS